MHAPSEHTFDNGKQYDVEIHFVHRHYESSNLAVVAVYFDMVAGGSLKNEFIDALNI